MVEVRIEIPKELEEEIKKLEKNEINMIVYKALKERLNERFLFKMANELLKGSKLTDREIEKFSRELKEKVAKRHGL